MEGVGLDGRPLAPELPLLDHGPDRRCRGAADLLANWGRFAGEFERVRMQGLRDLLRGPEQDVVECPSEGVGDGGFEFLEGDANPNLIFVVVGSRESDLAG